MLEIGCGIGRLVSGFVELFAEVWGVDVSEEMITQANQLQASSKVKFLQNSGYDLTGITDGYFDFVFSYMTFQHVPEKWIVSSYLRECHRVLRPGGIIQHHFRAVGRPLKDRIYLLLPRLLRSPAVVAYGLLTLSPRRLPLVLWPGGDATWMGLAFKPEEMVEECIRLGFVEVQTVPDESHPLGTRFWVIGKKANRKGSNPQVAP